MNKEIKKYIDEKVEQFKSELIKSIEEKENKPKTVWDLKDGDRYYIIYPRNIEYYAFNGQDFDIEIRENGNMFLTREEAEFELERRKIEAIMKKYSRPFECEKCNWIIFYDYVHKAIDVTYSANYDYGTIYFESKEVAQKVIDEVGKGRLLKYWFKVVN